MYRGTTPTNTFTTETDITDAVAVYISYKQDGQIVVEKTLEDITWEDDGSFSVKLSQQDTLNFSSKSVSIQIRAKFADGSAIASNIIKTNVNAILKDGVI